MSKRSWREYITLTEYRLQWSPETPHYIFTWKGTDDKVWEERFLWRSKINAEIWIEEQNWQARVDEQFEKEFLK